MRLLYLFPRATPDPVERAEEHGRRRAILQASASPGTTIDIRELEQGPPAIESLRDAYEVSPAIIALSEELEDRYEALIVGCFSDPAVDGAIEGTTIPIVGCALPAMATALLLGDQFAVLAPTASAARQARIMARAAGLLERYAGSVSLGIGVREFASDPARTLERVTEAGQQAMALGAEVLVLGCLSLAFTGVGDVLQERLGVPVVNPLCVAVRTCELLVSAGLTPSRRVAGVRAAAASPALTA